MYKRQEYCHLPRRFLWLSKGQGGSKLDRLTKQKGDRVDDRQRYVVTEDETQKTYELAMVKDRPLHTGKVGIVGRLRPNPPYSRTVGERSGSG